MPIETICRDCIFAVYENQTQTGCSLNKISMLERQGAEIVEAYDENNVEFFVIKGRLCPWYRTEEWAEDKIKEEYEVKAREEMKFPYHAVIIAQNDMQDVIKTANSFYKQNPMPRKITVVRGPYSKVRPYDLATFFSPMESQVKWGVKNMLSMEVHPVDAVVKSISYPYYVAIKAGKEIPVGFFEQLTNLLYDELFQFALIKFDGGEIVPITIHQLLVGNNIKSIEEKIIENNGQHLIFTLDDIYECADTSSN